MTNRRSFIKNTSLLSAGLAFTPKHFNRKAPVIGLQLYTVRDAMSKDPVGTLQKVASIGYNSVEGATYTGDEKFYGMGPKEFKKVLKDNGLIIPSSHYRLGEAGDNGHVMKGTMLHDWDKAVDDAAELGLKYMVCAWLAESERGTLDHYKYVADQLNIAGERCKKSGIQLCYHNHNFEFIKQDDKYPYDILLGADKNFVKFEVDLYWMKKAGQDVIKIFHEHPGRFPLWHVKDMNNEKDQNFAEVGSGIINFKEIFKYKSLAGMKYFFVEQDICPGSPFDSITKSINYIKKNLV
ncbi:MAG TPA: sugar phosphate isomerase/epimerase [Chitinophagaceae bacterium]|nr:sugar phosphate isomerase/epimerase [Chitinophagaceae bacterium]